MMTKKVKPKLKAAEREVERAAKARLNAAAPDGHEILLAIREFFCLDNPVYPSAMVLNDNRTLKQAVADYIAKVEGNT